MILPVSQATTKRNPSAASRIRASGVKMTHRPEAAKSLCKFVHAKVIHSERRFSLIQKTVI
ncbi:hypothetical protein E2C01_005643 [Portunus trituberculatus]|uniref:Uncharacterized protein n=1 Tax=Portunus trituberculatus TaxID=210409 RepID=A0A5B7CUU3_PORTR|nr:hypothetical protein [Portunus trituberculatus]